ncbi:MAG: ABC transporter ATP-binding protein [Clostridiales bacterium]|nr:ABC transporter ATP-binding protein [Clostridiales bacterium]
MIAFEHVSKRFNDVEVLKDISFEIREGDLVSLIGASGSGKTTTLKMINRLIDPSSGAIHINGEDIGKMDVIKLRRNMGYVIQQTGLFPHMTIRDNIEIIPRLEKRDAAVMRKKTLELMDMVGLAGTEFLDRYPTELSGGQQQRVGVARAFATDPAIILMDEPFSALDPITRVGLQDELINLQSTFRKTIVFVTHDMDEAIRISDRICIMDHGLIVQYDTPESILRNPANEFVSQFVGKKRIWASPEYIKASDVMSTAPATCSTAGFVSVLPDQSILDVLEIVKKNRQSMVPVLSQEGVLEGMVTESSLVAAFSSQYISDSDGSEGKLCT